MALAFFNSRTDTLEVRPIRLDHTGEAALLTQDRAKIAVDVTFWPRVGDSKDQVRRTAHSARVYRSDVELFTAAIRQAIDGVLRVEFASAASDDILCAPDLFFRKIVDALREEPVLSLHGLEIESWRIDSLTRLGAAYPYR